MALLAIINPCHDGSKSRRSRGHHSLRFAAASNETTKPRPSNTYLGSGFPPGGCPASPAAGNSLISLNVPGSEQRSRWAGIFQPYPTSVRVSPGHLFSTQDSAGPYRGHSPAARTAENHILSPNQCAKLPHAFWDRQACPKSGYRIA